MLDTPELSSSSPALKPRRRPKKVPAPVPGRLEDERQAEMFPDLPHLEEPVPADWEAP